MKKLPRLMLLVIVLAALCTSGGVAWASLDTDIQTKEFTTPAAAPTVTNTGASDITDSSARLNGKVTSTGGENPTVYIYWGDNNGRNIPGNWDNEVNLGIKGKGAFFTDIKDLTLGTVYYYACYAVNSAGSDWAYSATGFIKPAAPTVTNTGASDITDFSARLNGKVTSTGGEKPTVYIYWGDNDGGTTPGNWDNKVNLGIKSKISFFTDIKGLTGGTAYYYTCYAVNSAGSDWADSAIGFIKAVAPTVTNTGASDITDSSARLNGKVTSTGGENPTVYIYWGDNNGRNIPGNWDNEVNLGIKGKEAFFTDIKGLTSGTVYYYRCYVVNSAGSDWADSATGVATKRIMPTVTTDDATNVSRTSSRLNLSYDSGDYTVSWLRFRWRSAEEDSWSYTPWQCKRGGGSGSYHYFLSRLTPATTYYFAAELKYDSTIISGVEKIVTPE